MTGVLDIRPFLATLPESQSRLLEQALETVLAAEDSDLQPRQVHDIEPVQVWIRNPHYNQLARNVYPFWEDEIIDFVEGKYNEWIITGSLGTGKSTVALLLAMRRLYELSCWDIPQRLFRLADVTKIFFAYLSVNLVQAERTGFGDIRSMVDNTPYFQQNFTRNPEIDSVLEFPKNVFFVSGSDQVAVLGTNLLGSVLDEANFYRSGGGAMGNVSKAQEIYQETTDRRRSRFMFQGLDPGFSLLVSSASVQSSFTSARIRKKTDRTKVTVAKLWEVKPKNYSAKRFYVFNGSEREDAFLLKTPHDFYDLLDDPVDRERVQRVTALSDKVDQELIVEVLPVLPASLQDAVSAIPEDFRDSFNSDLYAALRNIGGVSVAPAGKLFTSRTLFNESIVPELFHPFRREHFELTLKGPDSIMDYFLAEKFFEGRRPRRDPGALRYLHIDQSKTTDWTGMACFHRSGYVTFEGVGTRQPIFEADFMLSIRPPKPPEKIGFFKIRAFILMLRRMGMRIGMVTFDQYQSEDHMQLLTLEGLKTDHQSVDRDDKAYVALVNLYSEGRIRSYSYEPYRSQLFNLDHDRDAGKVDHPTKNPDGSPGRKDVTDAVAGAIHNCAADEHIEYLERRENAKLIDFRPPLADEPEYDGMLDFDSWVVPKAYRGKIEKVQYQKAPGEGGYDPINPLGRRRRRD